MKKFVTIGLLFIIFFMSTPIISDHSGRLDSKGGHNCSSASKKKGLCTGYHYHKSSTSTNPSPSNKEVELQQSPTPAPTKILPPKDALPITIGSSKENVLYALGSPDLIKESYWWYGRSYVEFDSKEKVKSYNNMDGNLKVIVIEAKHDLLFSTGSYKNDVLMVMGHPTK